MRKSISKIALAASIGLALAFTLSCSTDDGGNDSDNNSGARISSSSTTVPSSSSIPLPSSSSVAAISSSSNEKSFVAEIGTVCVGYANTFSEPLDNKYFIADGTSNYINMYSICGDKATTPPKTGTASEITSWLNSYNLNFVINSINEELFVKGNSAYLGFYAAVDGYLRYLYVEELNDGKGLAKISAPEAK